MATAAQTIKPIPRNQPACCPHCDESQKIRYIDTDEIKCGSCGKTVIITNYLKKLDARRKEWFKKEAQCPNCGHSEINPPSPNVSLDELQCKHCPKYFAFPDHLCWHPWKSLQGEGTSRADFIRRMSIPVVIKPREKKDQDYWYLNDVLRKASKYGYGIPNSTYESWQDRDPDVSIEQWADYANTYIDVKRMVKERVSDPQYILDNYLRVGTVIAANHKVKSAYALSTAMKEVLPNLRPEPPKRQELLKRSQFPEEWITTNDVCRILNVGKDAPRQLAQRKKILKHPEKRGHYDRDSVFAYRGLD
ncbi:hypothetical protein MYX84_03035 [Acidobacteria bacterium AH-259-O06]|nr:hypothetical protein [Acidobacteria bacterium AH-259-O06]